MTIHDDDTRRRRKKLLAIGAGGLVLGVGAAATMAAWTDTERSTADFTAGLFDLVGSADGTTFTSNPDSPGLEISFDADSTLLSPGTTTYAPYAVQLVAGTGYAADVVLTASAGTGPAADALTYTILQTSTFGCDAGTTGTTVATDLPATSTPVMPLFSLDAAEEPTFLCFRVTADETLAQGSAGSIEWTLTATSTDPLA
jgi:predicted ribosomally synthesized peptide with SipW-like signal peptide